MSKKKKKTVKPRYLKQVISWLDLNNHEQSELFDYVESLRAKREWSRTFRDALKLIRSLRAGDASVLKVMFPDVAKQLASEAYDDKLDKLVAAISEMATPPSYTEPPPRRIGLQAVVAPKGLGVAASNDADLVQVSQASNSNSGANFLASLGKL